MVKNTSCSPTSSSSSSSLFFSLSLSLSLTTVLYSPRTTLSILYFFSLSFPPSLYNDPGSLFHSQNSISSSLLSLFPSLSHSLLFHSSSLIILSFSLIIHTDIYLTLFLLLSPLYLSLSLSFSLSLSLASLSLSFFSLYIYDSVVDEKSPIVSSVIEMISSEMIHSFFCSFFFITQVLHVTIMSVSIFKRHVDLYPAPPQPP
ncbi:unnamed protein product [Acanthosepion pharaonis]|uniref:Uncharacterized protein n=1 Tax=Acanthosepion pharaonis TaxID=158019 RepID=A0A812EKS3_ACAPH|nr:unnamed protein product [Sepia pharaonis]